MHAGNQQSNFYVEGKKTPMNFDNKIIGRSFFTESFIKWKLYP